MEMLELKNGSKEPESVVRSILMAIQYLWDFGQPHVLSDLLKICQRDPTYINGGANEKELKQLALMNEDGEINSAVRNVVLSTLSAEGGELQISSPVAHE